MKKNDTLFDFSKPSTDLMNAIESAGFTAWYVGGCVRDSLLGRHVSDIDIATSAEWEQVRDACAKAGFETRETGTDHGTITVLVPDGDDVASFEVTTFRTDSSTSADSRHPDSVEFVQSIEEDLARRDLTINAMAWHPERGLLDPFGGKEDLDKRLIRVVGDPQKRFEEDALRILRACRFAAQLGFTIDDQTFDEIMSHKYLVLKVSNERIVHELDLFLQGEYIHDALMRTVDVISIVLPELCAMKGCEQHTKYHIYDVLEHTAWALQYSPSTRLARWATLCHDMGKPATKFTDNEGVDHFYAHAKVSCELANGIAQRFSFSSHFAEDLIRVIREHGNKDFETTKAVKRMLSRLGGDVALFEILLEVMRADILSHAPEYTDAHTDIDDARKMLQQILDDEEAFTVKMLDINGNDLIDAGISQGPELGQLLNDALTAVIEGEVPNERESLLRYCLDKAQ